MRTINSHRPVAEKVRPWSLIFLLCAAIGIAMMRKAVLS